MGNLRFQLLSRDVHNLAFFRVGLHFHEMIEIGTSTDLNSLESSAKIASVEFS